MANKVLFVILTALSLGSLYWFLDRASRPIEGMYMPLGFGNVNGNEIQFDIAVGLIQVHADGPRVKNGVAQWDEWIDEHFDLRDATGNRVTFQRKGFSKLINDNTAGVQEFFLSTRLKTNTNYTLIYTLRAGDDKRYRYEFLSPTAAVEGERVSLQDIR